MANNDLPGRRLGKGMLVAAWLGIIVLLTYYFSGVEDDRYNPNRDLSSIAGNGYTELTLRRNAQGHYVAPGQINGKPVTFLLDTGATMVAVPYHMADQLGLRKGRAVPIKTANGTSKSYLTTIEELRLGEIVAMQVRGGLAVGLTGNEILLGMSVLADLEIIQRGNSLIIRQYR